MFAWPSEEALRDRRRVSCAKSGSAFAAPDTCAYRYNARSELTNATAAVDAAYRYGYGFDDIGNRSTSSERGTNCTYAANVLNQYAAVGGFVPEYDADGNQTLVRTSTGIWRVAYNGENRPVSWTQGTNTITMSFDRMGRRVARDDRRFAYDGYLQVADSAGNAYVWDPAEPAATRPLAWVRGGDAAYYTHDGNKNVSEVVAADGTLAAHYGYAPFGFVTVQAGPLASATPFRFSSEYVDDEFGLVYYNYRHYDPMTGRWIGRDPLEEIYDPNIYAFCVNSVSKYVDVLGLVKDYCCKLCLYSATPRKTFNDGGPIVVGLTSEFGHTWATKEQCNSSDDQIVKTKEEYSLGPGETIRPWNLNAFTSGKLKGKHWPTGDYKPPKYVVLKKCWKLGQDSCDRLKKDIRDKNRYPPYFTPSVYCTNTAIDFVSAHGVDDIPDANGSVEANGQIATKPNPKTLAENMGKNGGVKVKTPMRGR